MHRTDDSFVRSKSDDNSAANRVTSAGGGDPLTGVEEDGGIEGGGGIARDKQLKGRKEETDAELSVCSVPLPSTLDMVELSAFVAF